MFKATVGQRVNSLFAVAKEGTILRVDLVDGATVVRWDDGKETSAYLYNLRWAGVWVPPDPPIP